MSEQNQSGFYKHPLHFPLQRTKQFINVLCHFGYGLMIIYQCKYIFMIIVHFDSLLNPAVTVMETDWCLWVGPLKGRWCTKHPRHCQTACSVWHFAWSHSGCAEWSRDGTCSASCPGKFPRGDYTGTVSKIPVLSQLWEQVSFK